MDTASTPISAKPTASAGPSANPYLREGDGPWLRRYITWATPYYDKFPPASRHEMASFDRWLYSRKSFGFLLGLVLSVIGCALGLHAAGAKWGLAIALTFLIYSLCFVAAVSAWLSPEMTHDFKGKLVPRWRRNPWWNTLYVYAGLYIGSICGWVLGAYRRSALAFSSEQLQVWIVAAVMDTLPAALALVLLTALTVGVVTAVRKRRIQLQLLAARNQAERDAQAADLANARSQALQAQLKVLQAQIKPHFLFNTLAAVQHWVDTQDPRAAQLLRSLTEFLRLSTDTMAHNLVPLQAEFDLVQAYLKIMQFRMGERLSFEVTMDATLAAQPIPPAMVLCLVENAVEHGISPSLQGGRIAVRCTQLEGRLRLTVDDSGVGVLAGHTENIGLTNTRQRLAAHFGHSATLHLQAKPDAQGTLATLEADTAALS